MRRCLVRAMYLSASAVAVSTWGAISSARPLPLLVVYLAWTVSLLIFCISMVFAVCHCPILYQNVLAYRRNPFTDIPNIPAFWDQSALQNFDVITNNEDLKQT